MFDTRVFEKGHVFYKGFSGAYNNKVLKNEKHFYVAEKKSSANYYMYKNMMRKNDPPYVCTYKLTRPLRTLVITKRTIQDLLHTLDKNNIGYKAIKFAFAKDRQKIKLSLLRNILKPNAFNHYKSLVISGVSSRTSFYESNKEACRYLCTFLKSKGIDGYYYPGTKDFHEEIMICDASNKLLHVSCKKYINKSPTTNNRHVTFIKNVLENPKLENLNYISNHFAMSKNLRELHKKLVKNMINKQTSINSLNNLTRNKVTKKLKSKFWAYKNIIQKKRNLLNLPSRVKTLFNSRLPVSQTYLGRK